METEVKDVLFPSDNLYDIPVLRQDRQAGHLELPFFLSASAGRTAAPPPSIFMLTTTASAQYGKSLQN